MGPKSRTIESAKGGIKKHKAGQGFDSIRHNMQRQDNEVHKKQKWVKIASTTEQGTPKTLPYLQQDLWGMQKEQRGQCRDGSRPPSSCRSVQDVRQDDKPQPV